MARFSAIRIPSASKTPRTAPSNGIRAALAATMLASAAPAFAADVTPDRLLNPDREPQNWLMNHRTYDGQRFSPLARIDKGNVKNLKLAYAVALGGSAGDEWVEATPLFENGFIYVTDSWGVLYKIDARSGEAGRIVWRMEPKQERQANNRGAALWGNLVISPANWPARIIAADKETGRGDLWDYDEVGTHIMIDSEVAGQPRKLITHSARNGHLYTMDRHNGQIIGAKPYTEVNWTRGIDQKTGRPIEYDPSKDIQTYSGVGNVVPGETLKKVCPSILGGNNYWPSSYSPRTKLIYIPALTGCTTVEIDRTKHNAERGWNGGNTVHERLESNLTAVDPVTQEIKKSVHLPYPNTSGTLATGGGLVFLGLFDGTVAAFDDATLSELWKINVGSPFAAPPMTFEFNGKQFVAIASGRSPLAKRRADNIPELKEQRNATVLYVFGL
jgi:glucose dehydrogenase